MFGSFCSALDDFRQGQYPAFKPGFEDPVVAGPSGVACRSSTGSPPHTIFSDFEEEGIDCCMTLTGTVRVGV